MTIDITAIIIAIVGLLGAFLTRYLVPLFKSNVSTAQWDLFRNIVFDCVHAAEQMGITKKINDKLQYATDQVKIALAKHHITFDDDTIRAAIESEVSALNAERA